MVRWLADQREDPSDLTTNFNARSISGAASSDFPSPGRGAEVLLATRSSWTMPRRPLAGYSRRSARGSLCAPTTNDRVRKKQKRERKREEKVGALAVRMIVGRVLSRLASRATALAATMSEYPRVTETCYNVERNAK
jgi:hypothetical protein